MNTMELSKQLGIWMDYCTAYLMELTSNHFEISTIESISYDTNKLHPVHKIASLLETQKRLQFNYYHNIANEIHTYNRIIIFGPSNAKIELFDVLSEDDRFLKTKIEITNTDKMNPAEQHDFILKYFSQK
jgi:stalled ribosome rescue protein Dom34